MSDSNNVKKFAIGAAIAAAAGYVTGVLTAPKSGKETREELKETARKGANEAERELKRLHTELTNLLDESKHKGADAKGIAKKEFDDLADKAKVAKDKARGLLSALHDGKAEDKELKKAIDEAARAIDHIKKYLQK